jgi:hypothetical protein
MAAGRSADSRRGEALGGTQQQTVQTRLRQQERVPFFVVWFGVDAEASFTNDSIPTTAARATRKSRR